MHPILCYFPSVFPITSSVSYFIRFQFFVTTCLRVLPIYLLLPTVQKSLFKLAEFVSRGGFNSLSKTSIRLSPASFPVLAFEIFLLSKKTRTSFLYNILRFHCSLSSRLLDPLKINPSFPFCSLLLNMNIRTDVHDS